MSSFVKSHINFASLGRSLNVGQSSPIVLNMISLLSLYNGQLIIKWSSSSVWLRENLILISKLKKCFSRETYLSINNFRLRRALCQIRISAHELKIERDRYKKPYVERSQRICEKCSSNQTEDELHFIINCPLYIDNREIMFNTIGELCPSGSFDFLFQ
jgi:hypothetical protein